MNIVQLMPANYVLLNMEETYEKFLKNSKEQLHFMNIISTDYIRAYRLRESEFKSPEEIKVINKLIDFFMKREEYRTVAQLQRILKKEALSEEYMF